MNEKEIIEALIHKIDNLLILSSISNCRVGFIMEAPAKYGMSRMSIPIHNKSDSSLTGGDTNG